VFLLSAHPGATGVLYAGSGRDEWRWQTVSLFANAASGTCVDGVTCVSRGVATIESDPGRRGVLWGLSYGDSGGQALARSADEGVTWEARDVPALTGDVSVVDVARRSITVVGDFWEYAVSRDGGRSWAVGDFPKLASSEWTSTGVFDVAHFDRGSATAALPGDGPASAWAGNVFVFDGRRWTDATPPGFAGYAPTDAQGDPLSLTALTSTEGPLLALSSRGELTAFRR
jgi:hypothetical protein